MALVDCGWFLHGFAKTLLNMVGHSQQRKPHDRIYVCHRCLCYPKEYRFCDIYIYIFQNKQTIRPPKLMSPMNIWRWSRWCQFFCILLATVSDYFNSIFPWFGQNSEVKSASSAKEVDEYLSRHTLNQRFAGWFCLHIVPLVSVAQNSTKRMAIGPGLFAPDVGVNQVQWSIKQRKRLEYL